MFNRIHVNKLSQEENIGHVQSVFVMGVIKQTHVLVHYEVYFKKIAGFLRPAIIRFQNLFFEILNE